MTILDILSRAVGSVSDLRRVVQAVADSDTDLAPVAAELLTKLDVALSAEDLAGLAAALPGEIINAVQGKFDPRFHPGGAG